MFTSCLWQLWDWIDPQFATMDSKKLQALQQANSHLAPMPQTKPPTLGHHHDYRPTRSPVFQNYPQYQSLASNFANHVNVTNIPPQEQLLHKAAALQQQQQQQQAQLGYQDQIYQSSGAAEKMYHHQSRLSSHFPAVHQHQASNLRLQHQFQALEQEKIQQQIRTQNEALIHQQQTFAMRQQMNPPVPNFPSQTSSMSNMSSLNNVPQTMNNNNSNNVNRTLPPSSLNLQNQYQPAQSPLKINNALHAQQQQQIQMLQTERQLAQQRQIQAVQQMYLHQQQMQIQTPSDVPMIQQNIPGQVVNQAVQTQLSGMKNTTSSGSIKSPETSSTTPSTPATPMTPTHAPLEKKKSEPVHSLKSPVAKRHPNAPVALSGWLWKQGSEGLKVWRKRWFVLSEYCLFYYKGPEEEKIMGSVLLPSYKISACTADDKANRKYSFKCEHTNMRTYVLAAETVESMAQWVKALTMAAMMQGSSESESQPSITSSYNNPSFGDNSGDSGIHTFQTKLSSGGSNTVGPVTPASDNSHQPLYANAPPKPRRATDCGYSSPSPENAMDQYGHMRQARQDPIYGYKQQQQQPTQQQPPPPVINRSSAKTPDPILMQRMQQMRLEQNKSPSALKSPPSTLPHRSALEQEQYMQKLILHQQQLQQQQKYLANTMPLAYNNAERRTPDTYGPSARRQFGDYEDIYQLGKNSGQVMPQIAQQQQPVDMAYRRPMSPTKYDSNMQIPPMPQRYTPNFLEQQSASSHQQVPMRNKPSLSLARPHSADFLEYEARNPVTTRMKAEPAQAPRPKSSLDINRSQDNVYYSESNYAEKMRQSASYLQKQAYAAVPNNNGKATNDPYYNRQDDSSSIHPSMSSQTLQREIDMVRANRYEISDDIHNGSASVPRVRHNVGKNQHHHQQQQQQQQQQMSQQEQFLRSASARLPTKKGEEDPNRLDGERKREESMKRLLEWKQRMLQSPLTRKGPQIGVSPQNGQMNTQSLHLPPKSPLTIQNQGYYQQQSMNDVQKSNHTLQRSRSETHAVFPNEDSSDDEDESRVVLAGRSSVTPSTSSSTTNMNTINITSNSNVKTLKSALKINIEKPISTDMLKLNVDTISTPNTQLTPGTTIHSPQTTPSYQQHHSPIKHVNTNNSSKTSMDITPQPYVPVYKHNYVSPLKSNTTKSLIMELKSNSTKDDENESIVDNIESDKEQLDEKVPLETTIDDDEDFDDDEDDGEHFEYTDNDLDEALAEHGGSIDKLNQDEELSIENGKGIDENNEPMTPTINNADEFEDSVNENHYLPMTPKKAILSSSASETSILAMDILNSIRTSSTDAIEENPYIEMSSGLSTASEKQSSNYELVMIPDKKDHTEPLYMELASQSSAMPLQIHSIEKSKKSPSEHSKVPNKKRHSDKGPSRIKKRSHDLPDILKQSQQNYMKSDSSSDADDEDISKEPITLKSRTRFSLSDTFRPASYYLGASTSSSIHKNVPLAECLDSSDSEIVPPPPIPSTSPPETEEIFSSENFNTIKRNSTTSNEIIHQRTMSAGSSQLSERAANRFSLQDQLYKQQQQSSANASGYLNLPQFEKLKNAKLFSTASNCSINTDDGSNTSSDFDLYNKIKLQSPSISADSLNQSQSSLTESSPRPRPILGTPDAIVDDDDAMFKFEQQNTNDKLDHYLNKLETSDLFFSKEQTTWLTESLKHTSSLDPLSSLHYENINLMEQQAKQQQQAQYSHKKQNSASMYYDSLEDVSSKNFTLQDASKSQPQPQPLKEKNLSIHDALNDNGAGIMTHHQVDTSSAIFEMTQPSHSRNNSNLSDSAPYYYSDLTSETIEKLNNQRDIHASGKKNSNYISHIHNVINKQQLTSILKDQAEKEQGIDSRNIYESGSGRFGQKFVNKNDSAAATLLSNDFANNKIYYHEKNVNVDVAAASSSSNQTAVGNGSTAIDNLLYTKNDNLDTTTVDCDQLWEEDAIWRESLRRVSQRHARSLDDLDRIESISSSAVTKARLSDADKQWGISTPSPSSTMTSKSSTIDRKSRSSGKITREVTYVNEEHQRTLTKKNKNNEASTSLILNPKLDENDVYVQLACTAPPQSDVYEILRDDSNIDRENIRQWDMMSSGLIKSSSIGSRVQQQQQQQQQHQQKGSIIGMSPSHRAHSSMDASTAVGSIYNASVSVRNIRNIPKVPLTVKPTDPNELNRNINIHMNGTVGNNSNSNFYYGTNYIKPSDSIYTNGQIHQQPQVHQQEPIQQQYAVVKKTGSKRDIRENLERENSAIFKNLNVSAGDLLNRTHEELILLLIQLRKETSSTARSIEQCCTEIHEVQNRIRTAEGQDRAHQAERLEKLKQQLSELEKQYEKSKPLVNLVDNMVKLGSLYRGGNQRYPNETTTLDRLEFNQRIQERRLLQEEQRQWERMSPNQSELQTKVQQLYKLDQALQEESGTLQNLQRDKEDLERALYGLRSKLSNENAPLVVEAARRQQHALEMELSRVHQLLAENSKKLEQTVASNARLEQELLVLRQKLQQSRDTKNYQANLSHESGNGQTAVLESELRRVQQLVGDMQRQRQELSQAVRELTDSSNTIYQEMNRNVTGIKKRTSSASWTETDLDLMDQNRISDSLSESTLPLFIDTMSSSMNSNNIVNCSSSSKIEDYDTNKLMNGKIINGYTDDIIDSMALENDDFEGSAFSNLSQQEKQEIKTVRIVKRESERRQRDRERNGLFSTQNLDQVLEEEAQLFNSAINSDSYNVYQRSKSLPRGNGGYMETHEVYNQTPSNMPQYQLQSKYIASNDYYNSLNMQSNAYPVSVIDRVADLYSDSSSSQLTQIEKSYTTNYNYPSNNGNLSQKTESIQSLTKTLGELSPVFQSEAARQIIIEMSSGNSGDDDVKVPNANKQRRAIPKEKRRHFTAPHHVNAKTVQTIQSENDMNKNNVNYRARDDLDMEVALRPRINAPDVVRSALGPREKISENTIDKLFGAPSKILIPERYIPEQTPELSPEEKRKRQEKVEAIKKMLSETTPTISGNDIALPPSQLSAEKKQREHLLQLNQILAQQVMQMSKIVADNGDEHYVTREKAMAVLPSQISQLEEERELSQSPVDPLPIYQQRDNYFS